MHWLRFLFVAYTMSALIAVCDKILVNVLSMIFLSMCSFLILLFSIALINLLHPERVTRKFVVLHVLPLLLVSIIYWLMAMRWGNPILASMNLFMGNLFHPQVIIRIMTWMACVVQLVYFASIFQKEAASYKARLDEYFSENYQLNLPWVRLCFYGVISLGVYALIVALLPSPLVLVVFFFVLTIFFVVFGVCYIQYPRTYVQIEQVVRPSATEMNQTSKPRYSWVKLRGQVLDQKYYLTPGVSIEEMAQLLQIGRTTLSGLINKEERLNFNAWVGSLRIEEAMRIFRENPQLSIAQVSEMVGYSEPSNFSRQFKMITGVSPSEWYRQKHQPV
jgi:AraC-like DNA-binding protein